MSTPAPVLLPAAPIINNVTNTSPQKRGRRYSYGWRNANLPFFQQPQQPQQPVVIVQAQPEKKNPVEWKVIAMLLAAVLGVFVIKAAVGNGKKN